VSCENHYLVFEPSVVDGYRWFWRGRVWEGANNVYTRIIYRVYKRLHHSCYILFFRRFLLNNGLPANWNNMAIFDMILQTNFMRLKNLFAINLITRSRKVISKIAKLYQFTSVWSMCVPIFRVQMFEVNVKHPFVAGNCIWSFRLQ
jgi:hypothetical protein